MVEGKFPNGLKAAMDAKGMGPTALGKLIGEPKQNVDRWAKQTRRLEPEKAEKIAPFLDVSAADLLLLDSSEPRTSIVPVMGNIGAGGEIDPEYEQVPEDGLSQVEVPFPLPADMIAFEVRGNSMRPVYKDGHIVIVYREQKKPLTAFFGDDAAVLTEEGKRFIKTVMNGPDGTVTLNSWNADPIFSQRLSWIGEIFAVLPPASVRHIARAARASGW